MENMEELKKKIQDLECRGVKELKQELESVGVGLAKNNVLTEQNTEAMNNMSKTMVSIRETMVQISSAISFINKSNQELNENIVNQNAKIDRLQERQDIYDKNMEKVKNKVENVEDKGKFDIIEFIEKNFVSIIMSIGVLSYLFLK